MDYKEAIEGLNYLNDYLNKNCCTFLSPHILNAVYILQQQHSEIEQLKKQAECGGWIKTNDLKPKDGQVILFVGVNKFGNMFTVQRGAFYSCSGWYSDVTGEKVPEDAKVTHWRPLPDPPMLN